MCESNDRKWAVCACCVIAALGLAKRAPADELAMWKKDFKDPPLALKTIPLWHMNGKLTREEIASQLKASRDISGFAGVAVLPVRHTEPKYLTEDYFARYGDILEISKELGMSVVFYDDIGFPSGTAGGRMKAKFPDRYRVASRQVGVNRYGAEGLEEDVARGYLHGRGRHEYEKPGATRHQ